MTKAQRYFKKAGYNFNDDYYDIIRYENPNGRIIDFDLVKKDLSIKISNCKSSNFDVDYFEVLKFDEIKAICQQAKEFGWIE